MSSSAHIARVELRAHRVAIVAWFLGAVAASAAIVALFPVFVGNEAVSNLIDSLPRPLMMLFGVDPDTITSGVGFLQAQLYTFLAPMIVISYAISAGGARQRR